MKIRLDKNEMPTPPPQSVIAPVKESVNEINRYTEQNLVSSLVKLLSEYVKTPKSSIILSAGSDILIKEFIFLFSNKRQIFIVEPTFFLIKNTVQKSSSTLFKIRLREPDFKISMESFMDEIKKPTLIVLDNPNNPTGSIILEKNDVISLLENKNVILLIDEAYYEFSKTSYAHLTKDYPNLAVARTLSKSFGLAGSGIGYLIAGENIQKRFKGLDTMLPCPSVTAAIHALKNREYMRKFVEEVNNEKERIKNLISKMDITLYPSFTNFILMKTGISNIAQKLEKREVLISDMSNNYSLSSEYIRVSIGSKIENDYFIDAMKKIYESKL